jgi:hypothetical protein
MSDRFATVIVAVRIPSTEPYAETLGEVAGAIEDGVQRTGLTYRLEVDAIALDADGQWVTRI